MSLLDDITVRLERLEGKKLNIYDDATGKPPVKDQPIKGKVSTGTGRNLTDKGIREDERQLMLKNDINEAMMELDKYAPWWRDHPDGVRMALHDLCYNMGWPRLSGFKLMLGFLRAKDYRRAAEELRDSNYHKVELPERSEENAKLLEAAAAPAV